MKKAAEEEEVAKNKWYDEEDKEDIGLHKL